MLKRAKSKNQADIALQEVLNRLPHAKTRCVDVETSGLDWKRNHIVGYVVTFSPDPRDSYYVPVRHRGNANVAGLNGPDTAEGWDGKLAPGEKELLQKLDEAGTMWFGHNFGFDLKFIKKTAAAGNVKFEFNARCEDTQINEPLINEWAGKFSLEACANRHKVQSKKSKEIVDYLCQKFPEAAKDPAKAMGHYWRLSGDDHMAVEYAAGDGTSTWQVRDKQLIIIRKQEQFEGVDVPTLERVWDVESRMIPILARMSFRGIKVNEEKASRLRSYIKEQLGQLAEAFPPEFNCRSAPQVREWMERHGHKDWPTTPPSAKFPNGQPSMSKIWLQDHEAGRQVLKMRKFETLRDTFVLPLQTTHLYKGRVHTNYNQLRGDEYGVVVGRLSSNEPNLQAVPKHDEEIGYIYRELFEPDTGMLWGSPDYNQCEPRLLAAYSRCKVLLNGYRSDPPLDAHTAVAIACNKDWDKMSDKDRKFYRNEYAKRINQTIITGGGRGVLVQKYKVDPNEVNRVWNDYFRAMPEVKMIQQRMTNLFKRRGYMVTLLGRRCRMQPGGVDYVALNRILQGGNADILKYKLVVCDDYLRSEGYPIDILNNCHDAVDYQFSEDNRKHYDECLRLMQDFTSDDSLIKLDVPIPVDGGEGPNWAVATYGVKDYGPTASHKLTKVSYTEPAHAIETSPGERRGKNRNKKR